MSKRKRILLWCLPLLGIVFFSIFWVIGPGHTFVTHENFERIKEGMSREEVKAILGPPSPGPEGPNYAQWWYGPTATFIVKFDGDGKVEGKYAQERSLFDEVPGWLRFP